MTNNEFSDKSLRSSARPSHLVRQYYGLTEPGWALDLRCGTGADAVFLAEQGFKVLALDSLQENLEAAMQLAEKRKSAVDFRNLAAGDFTIRKKHYSLIVFGKLLRHLNKSAARVLAQTAVTGLKAGGLLIGNVLTVDDPSYREFRRKKVPVQENSCFRLPGGWIYAFYEHRELLDIFPNLRIIHYAENILFEAGSGRSGWEGSAEFVLMKSAFRKTTNRRESR